MGGENPFQSPLAELSEPVVATNVDRFRRIVRYWKAGVVSLLVLIPWTVIEYLCGASIGNRVDLPKSLLMVMPSFVGIPGLVGALLAGLLATSLFHPVVGVICGFLAMYPGINIAILFLLCLRARFVLKKAGYDVSFLGSDSSQASEGAQTIAADGARLSQTSPRDA
ncbi:MAG: hypothetical protein ACOY3P_07620 [Planctomycetota bacterium]